MGGWGSGYRRERQTAAEECFVLSMSTLRACGPLASGVWRKGSFICSDLAVNFELNTFGADTGAVWLQYILGNRKVHQCISLTASIPNFGGRRWWFRCPMMELRVSKLYLPPGEVTFGSRRAYKLTYRSCQESGRHERFLQRLSRMREAGIAAS
jgi:hypothetical protein